MSQAYILVLGSGEVSGWQCHSARLKYFRDSRYSDCEAVYKVQDGKYYFELTELEEFKLK